MRLLLAAFALMGLLLAGPAGAQDRFAATGSSVGQISVKASENQSPRVSEGSIVLAKITLRRKCPADQMRCACADTGTSACCTASQKCNCAPTANCR